MIGRFSSCGLMLWYRLPMAPATRSPVDFLGIPRVSSDFHEVGREEIRSFAQAVKDPNPLHWNEESSKQAGHTALLAPLTLTAVMGGPMAQRELLDDIASGYSLSQVLHIDQKHRYHRPIRAGDRLRRVASLDSFRQSAGTDLLVIKNIFCDLNGAPSQTVWTTLAARSGVTVDTTIAAQASRVSMVDVGTGERPSTTISDGFAAGQATAEHHPFSAIMHDSLTVGQALSPKTFTVTRGDLVRYSGVAGDPNPIHFSEPIAKLAGLQNVVAQAMFAMGIGGGYLAGFINDPAAVDEFRVRFTSPIYVPTNEPAEVTFSGRVKSVDVARRTADIALVAVHDGRKVFGRAVATVHLN